MVPFMVILGNRTQLLCRQSGQLQRKLDVSQQGMEISRVREAICFLMFRLFPNCYLTSSQTSPSLGGGNEKKTQTHTKALPLREMAVYILQRKDELGYQSNNSHCQHPRLEWVRGSLSKQQGSGLQIYFLFLCTFPTLACLWVNNGFLIFFSELCTLEK